MTTLVRDRAARTHHYHTLAALHLIPAAGMIPSLARALRSAH